MKRFLILAFAGLMLQSCEKDEETYGTTPEITFESISPGTVKQFKDSVVIGISYTDGDGDLGENGTGVENAFVVDNRTQLTYGFRIRQLAPDNANIIIRGKLNIVVPAVGLVNSSSTSETATFSIYVKDRAGNQSNTITSSGVTVIP